MVITKKGKRELKGYEVEEKQRGGPTLLKKFVFFQKWTKSPDMRSARLCVTRHELVSQQALLEQDELHFQRGGRGGGLLGHLVPRAFPLRREQPGKRGCRTPEGVSGYKRDEVSDGAYYFAPKKIQEWKF